MGGHVPAYVIYLGDVIDPEGYERYKAEAAPSVVAVGGRYIVRGGEVDLLEGELPAGRTVVLEFPTRDAALEWYHGEAYSRARALREGAARATVYVVDGVEHSGEVSR
jgi:uncharacterized protein (DUF1330 family)